MAAESSETIAAIATASGGGIGIVRISGPRAEAILGELVRPWPRRALSHRLHLGHVYHPRSGERLDQVLACVMRAPRSYTGGEVAELQGHGGPVVLGRVLEAVLACGARLAQPGEFTRRAFEAGRIDLSRAEAVAQLIGARSERALRAAQSLSDGALAREIAAVRGQLVAQLAELEGALDFPDEQLEATPHAAIATRLEELAARLMRLVATYREVWHRGAEVALVGRVNAGKSSLLNLLVGQERALVDAQPGTTRDVVQAETVLGGVPVTLCDTAGERPAAAGLELRGVQLGRTRRARADVAVLVVDGVDGFGALEVELWAALGPARLVAWNKRDQAPPAHGLPEGAEVVETCALTGDGVAGLGDAIAAQLGAGAADEGPQLVSQRQADALREAANVLGRAVAVLRAGEPPELAAVEARGALNHLGRVTGETADAEVLDAIFARFCIGK